MGSAENRISTHLTEIEIRKLLEAPSDSPLVVRANRHLDECSSCQLLLEEYAAKPDEWKHFVSIMELGEKQNPRAADRENKDKVCNFEELQLTRSENARPALNTVAIIAFVAVLACGVWFRLPDLLEYLNKEPSPAPYAPSAPPDPDSAPPAPTAPP